MKIPSLTETPEIVKVKVKTFLENDCLKKDDRYFCKTCGNVILQKWTVIVTPEGLKGLTSFRTNLYIPYCPRCENL